MYLTDLTHYLDAKGAIGPELGPARKMAEFLAAIVAHGSDPGHPDTARTPLCIRCRKRDERRVTVVRMMEDETIAWHCPACGTEGRISNWQGSLWDLSQFTPSS